MLGRGAELGTLKWLLVERTQGNPFFVEESIRSLVETGALVGERGAYRLVRPVQELSVPATAQAILAARIDRLEPADKRRLQAAAVVGKDVPLVLWQAIAEESEDELRAGIARLQAAEFLYEARLFPEVEYTFKHALTHEVAYGGLLEEQRQTWHAQLVSAIETLYGGDRLAEHVESLAEHAFRGADWRKALHHLQRAGMKAFARSALREAVVLFERALVAAERLPSRPDVIETALDLRLALRHSLMHLGEIEAAGGHLRHAEQLASALGDPRRVTQVLSLLTNYFVLAGEMQQASATAVRAFESATVFGDRRSIVMVNVHLGQLHFATGAYHRGREYLQTNIDLLGPEDSGDFFGLAVPAALLSRVHLAPCLAEVGAFSEAIRVAEEAMELAEGVRRDLDRAYALRGLGYALVRRGDLARAVPILEQGLALCRTASVSLLLDFFLPPLAYAYGAHGQDADARPLLNECLSRLDSSPIAVQLVSRLWAGDGFLLLDNADAAHEVGRRGVDLARRVGARGAEAWAWRLVAEVACGPAAVDMESAERGFRQALQLAEGLAMRPLVARCHAGLANVYRRIDKKNQALTHLATATTMYLEMGMTYWLEKAEREFKEQT